MYVVHENTYESADWLLDSFVLDSAPMIDWQKCVELHDFGEKKMRGGGGGGGGHACAVRFSYQITVQESVRRRCDSSLLSCDDDGSFILTIYQNFYQKVHVRVLF